MSMSYKERLSELDREGERSLTAQIADAFAGAIESGELGAGRPASADPRARRAGRRQPPDRRPRLSAARRARARLRHGSARGPSSARPLPRRARLGRGRGATPPGSSTRCPTRSRPTPTAIVGEMFRQAGRDDLSRCWSAIPAEALFPSKRFARAHRRGGRAGGPRVHQYGDVEGAPELREQLAELGRDAGLSASERRRSSPRPGRRRRWRLVAHALLRPGDVAAVESPTFPGCSTRSERPGPRCCRCRSTRTASTSTRSSSSLRRRQIKMLALQPRLHNPTGRDLAPERRTRLSSWPGARASSSSRTGSTRDLRFEGEEPGALRGDAPEHVIYISSLSKTTSLGACASAGSPPAGRCWNGSSPRSGPPSSTRPR